MLIEMKVKFNDSGKDQKLRKELKKSIIDDLLNKKEFPFHDEKVRIVEVIVATENLIIWQMQII